MPFKDPYSPEAIESQRRRNARWYEKNRDRKCAKKREEYAANAEAERERNREFRNRLAKEKRCVYCGKQRDRGNKQLCSACAPIHAEHVRVSHLKVKDAAFAAYGGRVCKCCGETRVEFITLDHMDGSGGEHRKMLRGGDGYSGGGGMRLYVWLKKNKYPPGFQPLCMNCNFSKGIYGYCPHERERNGDQANYGDGRLHGPAEQHAG